jgi:diacylglycerol kinase (ATP)
LMTVRIIGNGLDQRRKAFMVVLANASKYGTGAVINPESSLHDGQFELIIVRRLALAELIKMLLQHREFDPNKIDTVRVTEVTIIPSKRAYFQVDGEYRGRVNKIHAAVVPASLKVLLPQEASGE